MTKILIVDSNNVVAHGYGDGLLEEGYEVIYAGNSKECLVQIDKNKPNVILLETKLTEEDGIELLQKIKSNNNSKNIPILILTKKHDPDELTQAAKFGVTLYFVKETTSTYILNKWIKGLTSPETQKDLTLSSKNVKILLVEDDQLMIDLYQKALTLEGFDFDSATNGVEGLKKAKSETPDLILLDLMMPEMNGLDTLEELKKNSKTKHTPVIVLTNLVGTHHLDKAMELGAAKYIVKSEQEPKEIISLIKEVLGSKK